MLFLAFNLILRCDEPNCEAKYPAGMPVLLDDGTIGIAQTPQMKAEQWQIAVDPRLRGLPYKCYCKEHRRKVDTAGVKIINGTLDPSPIVTPVIQSKIH